MFSRISAGAFAYKGGVHRRYSKLRRWMSYARIALEAVEALLAKDPNVPPSG